MNSSFFFTLFSGESHTSLHSFFQLSFSQKHKDSLKFLFCCIFFWETSHSTLQFFAKATTQSFSQKVRDALKSLFLLSFQESLTHGLILFFRTTLLSFSQKLRDSLKFLTKSFADFFQKRRHYLSVKNSQNCS